MYSTISRYNFRTIFLREKTLTQVGGLDVAELGEIFSNFNTTEGESQGRAYQPAPSDIFVMTPAKCGTTWMQQIVHGLRTRGSMDFDEITCVVPWIEMAADMGIDIYTP